MFVDDSKIFLYGLPLDCQEDTLKDFLEAVCDYPGTVTKVSIPDKKTFAFVTLSCTEVAKHLLGNTLLYCDCIGQLYQVKARPYVKQQFRKKKTQDYKPKMKQNVTSMERIEPKGVKYKPPDHVYQLTPDYSMLSHSKPKRRKRKRDDLAVWLGDVGSTSFKKRPRQKKKKKKASKLELHRSESFHFGNLCPESKAIATNIEDTCTTDTTGAVEPVVNENPQQLSKAITTNTEDTTDTTGAVEPVVNENDQRLSKVEGKVPLVEVVHADDQKPSSSISSHTQVIVDHGYLGPLCLQFTSPPSVADVKNELMERTGLPVKDQLLYCNGKKLCDSLDLRPMTNDNPDSLTLVLSVGTLKGGVRPKNVPGGGATGGEDPSSSQKQAPVEGATEDEFDSCDTTTAMSKTENTQSVTELECNIAETKELTETKQPLAASDPSTKGICGTRPKKSKEDGKLLLLKNALQLDIDASNGSENISKCLVRSIFVKRGKGANALERCFNFIVFTNEEMTADERRKLWSKITEKTAEWIKLLPMNVSQSFRLDDGSFVHVPSNKNVVLRDEKVIQIPLEKLSDDEYKQDVFVILVDKQLLVEKKIYNFFFDSKGAVSYSVRLNVKSKYHASFDPNSASHDLEWSEHFRSLITNSGALVKTVAEPLQVDPQPSSTRDKRRQIPRRFDSDFEGKFYNEGFVFSCWETGSKDLIRPVHEFKLFRTGDSNSDKDSISKFVYETLKFGCGCLNERTNGTIHFGVADEVEGQTCGYQPKEIVGSWVTNKPLYSGKLTEFIDKCFVDGSTSSVNNCIRPPVFIPVKGTDAQLRYDKVVIEVDIVPSYSFCAKKIFKVSFKSLGCGKEAKAYIRHGSQTQAIVELQQMEDLCKRIPELDKERKTRERKRDEVQGIEKQESCKHLYDKLRRLLCANKKVLDSSVYPILVLSKPDASMNQEFLDKTFFFMKKIKWQAIIDFDDQGSDSSGLCNVFKKSEPVLSQCEIHEAEDYDDNEDLIEDMAIKTHWIFGNGYAKLDKGAVGFKQWNNSKRKRGLSFVIQSLAKKIPRARAVVLFLLFSKEYEPIADIFKDFCTYLDGPNQLIYAAKNSEIVSDWVERLSACVDEHELRERGVVGMSWSEFQVGMLQMISKIDLRQQYVTMAAGTPYPLENITFNNINIVSAKECEELHDLSSANRLQISSEVEIRFYRGYPVTWKNFWFTDAQRNHVLRRDKCADLKALIGKLHSRESEEKVQTITIYHHIGAGASTLSRQALWDFRFDPHFPYRCAVVTKIDDSTCKEILLLRNIGYGEESEVAIPPVLALVEDTDELLFGELRSQVVEHASELPKTEWPVCVFLYCESTQNPQECHLNEKETSVFLEQHLSPKEVAWFKDKYTDMEGQFRNEDPELNFETYANENLISFMIMKENFNPSYATSIVRRNLTHVTDNESTLLQYTSLLNIYNPYHVSASCFDSVMLSGSLRRRGDWFEDLTHSARIFLREIDRRTPLGTEKAIAVVHPIIADELLDQIAERNHTTVGQIAVDFLESPLLEKEWNSLRYGANGMLKHRKKYEHGDDVQTKFSPLIEKILYEEDTDDGKKSIWHQSIWLALKVLFKGFVIFKDPMLLQQMARVLYVHAAGKLRLPIQNVLDAALSVCDSVNTMNLDNYIVFHTKGRIYEKKIKVLYGPIRKDNQAIEIDAVTQVLPLSFNAMEWFQKSLSASDDYQKKYAFHGELSVMFYLLDVLRCVTIFRGQEGKETLQKYLAFCQAIPAEVEATWSEFHESIKDLRNRFSHCMEGLAEGFTIYKGNSVEERMLSNQIALFKAQYHSYFGEGDVKWNDENPEERWEYRWHEINKYLAGDIFMSVFRIHQAETKEEQKPPRPTLQRLKALARTNYSESVPIEHYEDILLIISTSMALHSPYGTNSKLETGQLVEEYKEMYKFVEMLFAQEESDEGSQRLYAHLFKVMFLWPRKHLELSNYRVQEFYDSMKRLRDRWERKCKGHTDQDKTLQQKMYKHMSFKKETRQYTTLFYLGKGTGLDAFVHINELTEKGSLDWESPKTVRRLKRLTGVVQSENMIRVENPLESGRTIDIYYSSFRQGGFSKEEVSFYLGFSWPQPIAFDVKYTNTEHGKHLVEFSGSVVDDQTKFFVLKNKIFTYEEYTSSRAKLTEKLAEINKLKEVKRRGEELDENQKTKLRKEDEIKEKLKELKKSLDALAALGEDFFD